MAEIKLEKTKAKGNSEDSLLVIYILYILKKYSSQDNPLSTQDVMDYLERDYSIGKADKSDAQKKKIRRHLDTLHECYGIDCIVKKEGKTRNGHDWYYDASKDSFAGEQQPVCDQSAQGERTHETLSKEEIDFIIDIIVSSKIINDESTRDIVKKLLEKTELSEEAKRKKLKALHNEEWQKSVNKELVWLRDEIDVLRQADQRMIFDYEDKKSILAKPYEWESDENGKYVLVAKLDGAREGEFQSFLLENIKNVRKADIDYDFDETYYDRPYSEPTDEISLESLFANIRKINNAINDKSGIEFEYLSYVVSDGRVVWKGKHKRVLPRTLVFVDGKYYLIGFDENAKNNDEKIVYYRVDLISKLIPVKFESKLSDWDKSIFDGIKRARDVEIHPLMLAGTDRPVTFKVLESALDRVIDAFGRNAQFQVTKETKVIPINTRIKKWYEKYSDDELKTERLVKVFVRTTYEEAFYWALANADAVELIYPLDLRYRLRRIAAPIQRSYVTTTDDQIRENVDRICESGEFNLIRYPEDVPIYESGSFFSTPFHIGEELAYESFKVLSKEGKLDVVDNITIWHNDADKANYLGLFKNTIRVEIANSPCKNPEWISGISGLSGISIDSTSIEDVCWLKEATKLQNVILRNSPISDLSVLREHEEISALELINIDISDISFIENFQRLYWLTVKGCPIRDYSPLLKIPALQHLEIDEKVVEALGIENIRKHHPNADISVQPIIID